MAETSSVRLFYQWDQCGDSQESFYLLAVAFLLAVVKTQESHLSNLEEQTSAGDRGICKAKANHEKLTLLVSSVYGVYHVNSVLLISINRRV